jgi:alpha-L-fucosidase
MKKEYVVEVATLVRELQPNAMMCSRVGHGMGDYSSNGDMEVPTKNIEGLWESCDTNNNSWSFAWYDNNFKNPKEILNRLISTVARGGSYLFNVGPNGKGEIPEIGAQFLKEAGDWIKQYPQVVYGAGSSPWGHPLPWGDITTKDNSLFLSVLEWPADGKLYLPGLNNEIKKACILNGKKTKSIKFSKEGDWTVLSISYKKPVSPVTVIELKLTTKASEIVVKENLGIYPNINNTLLAELGEATNAEHKKVRWMEKFGEWVHAHQVSNWKQNGTLSWDVNVQKPGYYYVDLCYRGDDRLVWKVSTDEGVSVQNQQAATEKYINYNMGILEFKTPGKHTISVSLIEGNKKTSSLKSMLLKPAK